MSKQVKFNIQLSVDGQKVVVAAKTSVENLAQGLSKAQEKGEHIRMLMPLRGGCDHPDTQGVALGYVLVGLSGRHMNTCG